MTKRSFSQLSDEERERGLETGQWPDDFSKTYDSEGDADDEGTPPTPPAEPQDEPPEKQDPPAEDPPAEDPPAEDPPADNSSQASGDDGADDGQPPPDDADAGDQAGGTDDRVPHQNKAFAAMRRGSRKLQRDLEAKGAELSEAQQQLAESQRQVRVMQMQRQLESFGGAGVLGDDGSIDQEALSKLEPAQAAQVSVMMATSDMSSLVAPSGQQEPPARQTPPAQQQEPPPEVGYTQEQLGMSDLALDDVPEMAGPLEIYKQQAQDPSQPTHLRQQAQKKLQQLEEVVLELEADEALGGFESAEKVADRYREAAKRMGWTAPSGDAPRAPGKKEPRQGPESLSGGSGEEPAAAPDVARVTELANKGDMNGVWLAIVEEGSKISGDSAELEKFMANFGVTWAEAKEYAKMVKG